MTFFLPFCHAEGLTPLLLDLVRSQRKFKMLVKNTGPRWVTPSCPLGAAPGCFLFCFVLFNPCLFFTSWWMFQTSMKFYSIREYCLIFNINKYPCIIWEGRCNVCFIIFLIIMWDGSTFVIVQIFLIRYSCFLSFSE